MTRRRRPGAWEERETPAMPGVALDAAGYLVDGLDWTPRIAEELARTSGFGTLRAAHWTVLTTCREVAARTGTVPSLDQLAELTAISSSDLDRLFAGRPAIWIARLAGLPNPHLAAEGVKGVPS